MPNNRTLFNYRHPRRQWLPPFALIAAIAILTSPSFIPPAFSQSVPGQSKFKKDHDPNEVAATPLSRQPDFPGVPPYGGGQAKYLDGLYHPNMNNGRKCVQGRYLAKEDSTTVLNWYRDALRNSGWTLEQGQTSTNAVAGRKESDNAVVFVRASERRGTGYKCEFVVRYIQCPPPPMPNSGA